MRTTQEMDAADAATDDGGSLGSQLQRLLEEALAEGSGPPPRRSSTPLGPVPEPEVIDLRPEESVASSDMLAAIVMLLRDVNDHFEHLRSQVEATFEKLSAEVGALEARQGALDAALNEQVTALQRVAAVTAEQTVTMQRVEAATAEQAGVLDRIDAAASEQRAAQAELGQAIGSIGTPDPAEVSKALAGPIEALQADISGQVADHLARTRAAFDQLTSALIDRTDRTTEVAADTASEMREALAEASTAHARELAKIRESLAHLSKSVTKDQRNLDDVRDQLDWIRQSIEVK